MARRNQDFQTIHSEGGLLPPDLLRRVLDPKERLEGTLPTDYGLAPGERLNEVITQSWNRLRKHWADFRAAAKALPAEEAGTGLTNDKWSIPLLRELDFGMLPATTAPEINGKTYAITRFFGATAVHLIGCGLDLDRRAKGVRGAAIANPHGLVQDFLNRSEKHLWAILSNGLRLRILRDSQAISRQSFLEFDLEAMFDGEVYADFVLLWLVAHSTRFAARESDRPETCWLEQWTKVAEEQGVSALKALGKQVEKSLQILGDGLVSHPKNTALRDALRTGTLTPVALHGQLLRVVYRLIFLFVAEDRTLDGLPLLHPHDNSDAARIARERYREHYSAERLRDLAGTIRGSRHGDLWHQFNLVAGAVSGEEQFRAVRHALALPALGSFLWSPASTAALNARNIATSGGTELTNADFLAVIRKLAFTEQGRVRRPVDYKNLGAEELGGVYESLLALTPQVSGDGAKFTFAEFAGNERKTSGSYYTPDSLVQCLLDSALEPVIEGAIKGKSGAEAEKAILEIKVCDPAVGSGHFLVGAAHRLARHVARTRAVAQGEGEPSPDFYIHALRDVIGRCLYGVDINPMAAELCRVSLWLEALEPGKPLSFLDHHVRVGNSLMGTTPELIVAGLPDDAFTAIEGDDKKTCTQLKKKNKAEREGFAQGDLLGGTAHGVSADVAAITAEAQELDAAPDDTADAIAKKADQFHRLQVLPAYRHAQLVADAWCAAFVWPKSPDTLSQVVTTRTIQELSGSANALTAAQRSEVERLSGQYQFFHWHLAFPEVFANGGFDCVLGNPPWDRVKIQEKEWFSEKSSEISSAPTATARKKLIDALPTSDPELHGEFLAAVRKAEGDSHFLSSSGRYPLCGRGDINVYSIFAETFATVVRPIGYAAALLPQGIATDDTTKVFFAEIVNSGRLSALYGFINEEMLFPSVLHNFKFCILIVSGISVMRSSATIVFNCHNVEQSREPARRFSLTASDIALVNPNTRTCPVFFWRASADITKAIYRRVPIVSRDGGANAWPLRLATMFHMANDSSLFSTEDRKGDLPLYEAKMFEQFNHRYASYEHLEEGERSHMLPPVPIERLRDSSYLPKPCYWVKELDVAEWNQGRWRSNWYLGFREITSAGLWRTTIAAILPKAGFSNKIPLVLLESAVLGLAPSVVACLNCFALDFVGRQKLGGASYSFFIVRQLPLPEPSTFRGPLEGVTKETVNAWVLPRVLELTYTAWNLEPFAKDCGFDGPPFLWDEDRRFLIRAELDAAFFHLYLRSDANGDWVPARKADGCPYDETLEQFADLKKSFPKPRDAVDYIMDTFPIVKRKDEEKWGTYRTKDTILDIYDEIQEAVRTGKPYQTRLLPEPGSRECCHPPKLERKH